MSLAIEYKNQSKWRNWKSYLDVVPITDGDIILDLGCSVGTVSKLLAERANHVIGIDNNPELLNEALHINPDPKIKYLHLNLSNLDSVKLPMADGIWCSFVAAYFPDFGPVIQSWQKLLRPGGWLAIVEMSGLFDHEPLSENIVKVFKDYYSQQRKRNIYDFEMGSRLKGFLERTGFKIIHEEDKQDIELAFDGPASPNIIEAWENRFNRMFKFREHVGESTFQQIKREFIGCLKDNRHVSRTIVKYVVSQKC